MDTHAFLIFMSVLFFSFITFIFLAASERGKRNNTEEKREEKREEATIDDLRYQLNMANIKIINLYRANSELSKDNNFNDLLENSNNEIKRLKIKIKYNEEEKTDIDRKLSKANSIIRKANKRVNELKEQLNNNVLKKTITKLECEISELKSELSESKKQGYHGVDCDEYELFGLNSLSSKIDIKRRYKMLSSIYHPDKNNGNGYMMKKINTAYNKIK